MTISEQNDADLMRPMTRVGATHASPLRSPAHVNGRTISVKRSCTGGNTDFINMLAHDRLVSNRISKMESVQS